MDPDTAESSVFIPSGRGGLNTPHGLAWDLAGNAYVSCRDRDEVLRFSRSGAFDRVFVSAGRGGLNAPAGLAFGADVNGDGVGELHVSSSKTHSVMRFDGATGEPLPGPLGHASAADLVPPGSGGLRQPQGMCIYDGHIYVASFETAKVLRYDMLSGEFAGVAAERPGLASVEGVAVWDGQLYVNNRGTVDGPVLRFNLPAVHRRSSSSRPGAVCRTRCVWRSTPRGDCTLAAAQPMTCCASIEADALTPASRHTAGGAAEPAGCCYTITACSSAAAPMKCFATT